MSEEILHDYGEGTFKMKRISVFIRESQLEGLGKRHEETGMPVSEIIRRAIDEYLKGRDGAEEATQ